MPHHRRQQCGHALLAASASCILQGFTYYLSHSQLRPATPAGNTGAGIYKATWPSEAVIVDVRGVAELDYIRSSKVSQQQ